MSESENKKYIVDFVKYDNSRIVYAQKYEIKNGFVCFTSEDSKIEYSVIINASEILQVKLSHY